MSRVETIALAAIRIDGETQARVKIDPATVAEYEQAYKDGVMLPRLDVVYDSTDYWCWDGVHRRLAAEKAGLTEIQCNVADGTLVDAQWFACSANQGHGLKRTNADKRKAVEKAMALRPQFSNNLIARHCGVDETMVRAARDRLRENRSQPATPNPFAGAMDDPPTDPAPDVRVGADGRAINTANIGKGPKVVMDSQEMAVPEELLPVWATAAKFDELSKLLKKAQELFHELAGMPGGETLRRNLLRKGKTEDKTRYSCEHIANAIRKVKDCRPHASCCPYCLGEETDGEPCKGCEGRGWVTERTWAAAPDDYREAALARAAS